MKIARMETTLLSYGEIPTTHQPGKYLVVKVHTDEGLVGISRGHPGIVPLVEEHLAPQVVGENPLNVERLWQKMYELGASRTFRYRREMLVSAIGALDIALWDILGKASGLPIYQLLGGYRDHVPAYADQIEYPAGPNYQQNLELVERCLKEGFWAVKIHLLPEEPELALEKAQRTRRLIGKDIVLGIDLWRLWEPHRAAQLAHGLEDLNVHWLEEPMLWDDPVGGAAYVASQTDIPISGGEVDYTFAAWRDLLSRGRVKIIQPDIISGGGFTSMRRVAALAAAHHGMIAPHGASFPEFIAHLIAGVPNGFMVSCAPKLSPTQLWTRLYKEPIRLEGGWIELTPRPGLGLELDEDFIQLHRICSE